MTAPLLIGMPRNEAMTKSLAQLLGAARGQSKLHTFPDVETHFQYLNDLWERHANQTW